MSVSKASQSLECRVFKPGSDLKNIFSLYVVQSNVSS